MLYGDFAHLGELPQLPNVRLIKVNDGALEAELPKDVSITRLVQMLAAEGILVDRLRNKANRLEELFLRLVEQPQQ